MSETLVVRAAVAPLNAEPTLRSEQGSQLLPQVGLLDGGIGADDLGRAARMPQDEPRAHARIGAEQVELLAQHPQLLTLIDASLGRGAVIGSLSAIRKGPGPGTIPLHVDYAHVPEPFPEWAVTGVGVSAPSLFIRSTKPGNDVAMVVDGLPPWACRLGAEGLGPFSLALSHCCRMW